MEAIGKGLENKQNFGQETVAVTENLSVYHTYAVHHHYFEI